jgi:hypothetical protein
VKQDLKLGPTLMQLSRSGAMTPAQTGAILASLYMSVHKTPPPPDVLFLRDWLAALQLSGGIVPKHIATGVLTLIELAPEFIDDPQRPRSPSTRGWPACLKRR